MPEGGRGVAWAKVRPSVEGVGAGGAMLAVVSLMALVVTVVEWVV